MKCIYKYPLALQDTVTIEMPGFVNILHVDTQAGELMVWALVDTEMPMGRHVFHIIGTGHPCEHKDYDHVGTVMAGDFVWHIFYGGVEGYR